MVPHGSPVLHQNYFFWSPAARKSPSPSSHPAPTAPRRPVTHVCFRSGLHTWEDGAGARGRCDITSSHSSGSRRFRRLVLPPEPERKPGPPLLRPPPISRSAPSSAAPRLPDNHSSALPLLTHTHTHTGCGEGRARHYTPSEREREREQRRRGGLSKQSGRGEEVNTLIGASPLSPD